MRVFDQAKGDRRLETIFRKPSYYPLYQQDTKTTYFIHMNNTAHNIYYVNLGICGVSFRSLSEKFVSIYKESRYLRYSV